MTEHIPAPNQGAHAPATTPSLSVLARVVTPLVALTLGAMVALPIAQSVARLMRGDIPSAGNLTQHLTLWVGFLGAVLATVTGSQLALNTSHLLPEGRPRRIAAIFSNALSAAIVALLTYAAAQLIDTERADPSQLVRGLPTWWSETVVPFSLALIAVRYVWGAPGGWLGRGVTVAAVGCAFALGLLPPPAAGHLMWPCALLLGAGFLLGAPVFSIVGGVTALLYFRDGEGIIGVTNSALQLVKNTSLPAVPLLTLAGYVLASGGASQRLVRAYRALLGWLPAGMALMALSVCALFTAFTGASGVTILAMGGLVLPLLLEEGYPEGFSVGLVTASGSLGLLFPPSLPVILYYVVLQSAAPPGTIAPDLKHLYLAGAVPGVLIILLVALYAMWMGVRVKAPRHRFERREALAALWGARWDLALPVVVITLFGAGVTVLLETAAIAALYAMVLEMVVYRTLHPWRDLPRVMGQAATLVGAVLLLLGMAFGLNEWMVLHDVPQQLLDWAQAHIHSRVGFLLALNALLLVLGSVLEMYSAIFTIAPLIAPLGLAYDVDPIHLGVVFLANLELGFLLPPMGLNLFLSATRFERRLEHVYRYALPFLAIMSVGVLLVTYVPAFTTGVLALLHIK